MNFVEWVKDEVRRTTLRSGAFASDPRAASALPGSQAAPSSPETSRTPRAAGAGFELGPSHPKPVAL